MIGLFRAQLALVASIVGRLGSMITVHGSSVMESEDARYLPMTWVQVATICNNLSMLRVILA